MPTPSDLLPHLRRARDLMDSRYADDLNVATIAQRAGVSKYYFIRSFNAEYGQTPAQYLTHRRIERAQDLLRATNLTVTEICMLVGYTSLGSFSAKFRSLVGETPSAFQQRYGGNGVPHIPGCYVFMRGFQERAIPEKPAEGFEH
jgi:AraC-like DNA-binding protein